MVRDFPRPYTQHKLREFLGLINFYHRFLKHGAAILKPPNDLLTAPTGQKKELVWTDATLKAFTAAKDTLANAMQLSHPVSNAPTSLMTEASDVAVGAVLQQFIEDELRPITYVSRKLKLVETRYSTFDRELLAIYLSIKHFWHILEGSQFYVLTNHRPLTYSLSSSPNLILLGRFRHVDFIFQFTLDILRIQVSNNQAADALLREQAVSQNSSPVIDFRQLAIAQRDNHELSKLRTTPNSLDFSDISLPVSGTLLTCDKSTGTLRPVVAVKFQRTIFEHLHSLSHPSIQATQSLVTTRYFWPGINKDVQ